MENFEYIEPPYVPGNVINNVSNENKYLEQIIRDIMIGGKNNVW